MKNKVGIIFSVISILIFIILFLFFLNFQKNEDVRTNVNKFTGGVYQRTITNAEGSIDEHCGEFILDKTENTNNGIQEIGHIGNKNSFCYFKYKYIMPFSYIVGVIPAVFISLSNFNVLGYSLAISFFVFEMLIFSIIGYIFGITLYKLIKYKKTK